MTDDTLQLSPEIRSLMGVYALYWMLDDAVERMDQAPRIGRLESRILIRLDRPRRMGALAQLLLTGPPSVTAAADRLEEMGLVQRLPDPDDRRALFGLLVILFAILTLIPMAPDAGVPGMEDVVSLSNSNLL